MSWLESLKPGDKVIVKKNDRCYQQDSIETIKSIGKKFISLQDWEGETRFRTEDGSSVHGGMLDSYQLYPLTKEASERIDIQRQRLECLRKIEKINFNKLPIEKLKQIIEVVEQQ